MYKPDLSFLYDSYFNEFSLHRHFKHCRHYKILMSNVWLWITEWPLLQWSTPRAVSCHVVASWVNALYPGDIIINAFVMSNILPEKYTFICRNIFWLLFKMIDCHCWLCLYFIGLHSHCGWGDVILQSLLPPWMQLLYLLFQIQFIKCI